MAINWEREFTHSISPLSDDEKLALIATFLRYGTGFAVVNHVLFLSDASMEVLKKERDARL